MTETVRDTVKKSMKENKESKLDVDYSAATNRKDQCGHCIYFIEPDSGDIDAEGTCKKVLGAIHRKYWCELFEAE